MALDLGSGLTVAVVPPDVPVIVAAAPTGSGGVVVPVAGPAGPPGLPGGGGFRFDQPTAAAVWTIPHNLGRYPAAVSLHSADLSVDFAEFVVQHLDLNTLRVSMDVPTAGTALLI